MAIVGKIGGRGFTPLLLCKTFAGQDAYKVAQQMCQWVNADDEQYKGVVSCQIVPDAQYGYAGIVFYWSNPPAQREGQ